MNNTWFGVLVLLSLGGAGCDGYKIKKSIEAHRDAGKAQLAALNKLAVEVETHPPVTAVEWKLPSGVKLDFQPIVYGGDSKKPTREVNANYNAAMTHAAYLRTPCQAEWIKWGPNPGSDLFIMTIEHSQEWLEDPACWLDTNLGKFGSEIVQRPSDVSAQLDQLIRTKYVVALRLRKFESPSINLVEGTSKTKSFNPGVVEGDAVVFEIATATYVGGFPIRVESGETAKLKKHEGGKELALQLSSAVGASIRAQLSAVGNFPYN